MLDNIINGFYYVLVYYFILKKGLVIHAFFKGSGANTTNKSSAVRLSQIVSTLALGIFWPFNWAHIKDPYLTNLGTDSHALAYTNLTVSFVVLIFSLIGWTGSTAILHIAKALCYKVLWFCVYSLLPNKCDVLGFYYK